MLDYIAELLGTFFFISIILWTGSPLLIAAALFLAIVAIAPFSKSNLNPAVSLSLLVRGDMDAMAFGGYVFAQLLGGVLAALAYKGFYVPAKQQ